MPEFEFGSEESEREVIFKPNPGPQTEFLAASEREVLYGGSAGGGKALEITTKIPVPLSTESSGFKEHGRLRVGDEVYTPEGTVTKVIQVHPIIKAKSYTVKFASGEEIIAHPEHLWSVVNNLTKEKEIVSTEFLFKNFRGKNRNIYHVPVSAPIAGDGSLPIDPYLFGVWLGDGTSTSNQIGMAEEDFIEILPYLPVPTSKRIDPNPVRVKPFLTCRFEELNNLWKLGVYKNKHIPAIYKRASVEARFELLRGLLDTDGTVDARGHISIGFSDRRLADDLIELVNSLGLKMSLHTKKTKCKDHFRGNIYTQTPLFKLPRKLERQKTTKPADITKKRPIISVFESDVCEMNCITVESEAGEYLVGSTFITTHNSYAILADALRDLPHPQFRGLIVRRTTEELRELVQKSQELYPKAIPGIKWSERKMEWRTPAGGSLWMSYLERDQDVTRYQGQAFNYIAFDELTQWSTPYAWNYMRSRLRTTAPDLKLYMRASTNPGGPGHNWVKKMFIDPAPWGKPFWATDIETGETLVWPKGHTKAGQPLFKRRFIPARLSDNPYLYDSGDYEANLLSLPEAERRRLLEGDWDVVEGNAFPEWNRKIHVVAPYEIPYSWRRFRACDYGYGSHSAVVWFAVTPEEQLVIYRELYVSKVLAADLADMILDLEADDGPITYGVLDSSCWHNRGNPGPSIAESMIARGCRWRPSDRSKGARVAGKNEVHRRLQVDEYTEEPRMVVFANCVNTIAQLPVIPLDPHNPEDVDTKSEDHLYDAIRYGVMSRPRSTAWDVNPETVKHYRPVDSVFGY